MQKTAKTLLNDACAGVTPPSYACAAASAQGPFVATVSLPASLFAAAADGNGALLQFTGGAAATKKAAEQAAAAQALAALGVHAAAQGSSTEQQSVVQTVAAVLRTPDAAAALWALARALPTQGGAWLPLSSLLLVQSVRVALSRAASRRDPAAAFAALQHALQHDSGACCAGVQPFVRR
jgi:hypothetical protein